MLDTLLTKLSSGHESAADSWKRTFACTHPSVTTGLVPVYCRERFGLCVDLIGTSQGRLSCVQTQTGCLAVGNVPLRALGSECFKVCVYVFLPSRSLPWWCVCTCTVTLTTTSADPLVAMHRSLSYMSNQILYWQILVFKNVTLLIQHQFNSIIYTLYRFVVDIRFNSCF